jgi:hypothetical protein
MTSNKQILKLLKQWAPDCTALLDKAGYFSLDEGIAKSEIEKAIGLQRGGRLYRQVLTASLEKNGRIWPLVINEFSLREFKSGAREVAASLNIPFSPWDWNAAAQDYFEKDGLSKVKLLTQTDIDSLRQRIQYDFGMNPKTFAEKYAESYSCSESRLERIKRSETHSAAAAGSQEFATQADAKYKKWNCHHLDQWPRPSHREQEDMIIPIDDEFPITQEQFPSQVNCRCFLTYYFDMP